MTTNQYEVVKVVKNHRNAISPSKGRPIFLALTVDTFVFVYVCNSSLAA